MNLPFSGLVLRNSHYVLLHVTLLMLAWPLTLLLIGYALFLRYLSANPLSLIVFENYQQLYAYFQINAAAYVSCVACFSIITWLLFFLTSLSYSKRGGDFFFGKGMKE